jgi:hypothetical protein
LGCPTKVKENDAENINVQENHTIYIGQECGRISVVLLRREHDCLRGDVDCRDIDTTDLASTIYIVGKPPS